MQLWASRLGIVSILLAGLAFGQQPDRITEAIGSAQMVPLPGNMHGLARPQYDVGRLEGSRQMYGIRLAFRLSAAQQAELDQLLPQLQDRNSPNYHKFLTVAQFADRFGLSRNDINKVTAWLLSEGFTNISVVNNRLEVSFDGTVAQVERVFATEIHTYLVNGELHFANATDPSVPAALAEAALAMRHLHNFSPKPRVKVQKNFTSYITYNLGNHFLAPGDFATIYDVTGLYNAGFTGTGQTIAIVGQSTVSTTDLNNFRSAAGLPPSTVTQILVEGTPTRCTGDETESDLDLEWSGGVAKDAQIYFVYAGLGPGDVCGGKRADNVFDAIEYALTTKPYGVAPFVSTSYGACESANGEATDNEIRGWVQEGQLQGQTLTSASGDQGAADCEPDGSTSATTGLAVDMPGSFPETTSAGGNEFMGDSPGTQNGNQVEATQYWAASGSGSDTVDSALSYIPEEAWNDTTNPLNEGVLSASGGGASIYYTKPTWQTGTGVPNDGARDVPDIAISASVDHDAYLICSEDQAANSCTSGFRDGAGGVPTVVGGTSAAAPTFTAIMALVNQYLGNTPPTGLAPINPTLYTLPGNNPNPFHDVTIGNNIVPCTEGKPDCPTTAPFQFGYSAGVGYDQVTGLGSVDAYNLAQAWAGTIGPNFTLGASPTSISVVQGATSSPITLTITPSDGFNSEVTFSCSGLPSGATCTAAPVTPNGTSAITTSLTVTTSSTTPAGTSTITVTATGPSTSHTTTFSLTVTAAKITFSSSLGSGQLQVTQGASGSVTFTITGPASLLTGTPPNQQTTVPVTWACSAPEATGLTCTGPTSPTTNTSASFTIQTTAPTAAVVPFGRGNGIVYAVLFPGLLGILFTVGSRRRALGGMRLMGLIALLGFSTLWLGSCSGSNSSTGNSGTPVGQYTITVNASTTSGLSGSASFTLNVVAQ